LRIRLNLTQIDAAKRLKSSQSRVAKMEAADANVSLDLLLRALLTLGASPEMLARTMRRCA
jgi:transcriptional regulator with XRE-family HTH domain